MGEFLYYSVNRLGRHPVEMDLTLSQMADVVWAGREADKMENRRMEAFLKAIAGRMI